VSGPNLPIIVITEALDAACADWLAQHTHVVWAQQDQPQYLIRHLPTAQGLIVRTYTQVDRHLLDQAPRLKAVGRAGVGLDNIDLQECEKRGIQVVYTPHANTQAVVEYVLALVFDRLRPRPTLDTPISPEIFHAMRRDHVGTAAAGLHLGILGFGRIGKRLGQAAHAIGMKILVNDLLPDAQLRQAVQYPYEFVDKPSLYRQSDILSIHVDGRCENRHLIDANALCQLKPGCLLINTSRGMVIDPAALAQWAKTSAPAGGFAVLDVHDPEPPPQNYPLYGLPNVRLLPHLASRTHAALQNMSWVVRDVVKVLQGQTPDHPAF